MSDLARMLRILEKFSRLPVQQQAYALGLADGLIWLGSGNALEHKPAQEDRWK